MNYPIECNVGCNIVDPDCDKGEHYTKDVYFKQIKNYATYGISHLEFSHVTMLSEDDAYMLLVGSGQAPTVGEFYLHAAHK